MDTLRFKSLLNCITDIVGHMSCICTTPGFTDRPRWLMKCKTMSLLLQAGEAAHQNSMAVTASRKETLLKRPGIYRQSKTSCLFASNPHGGTCSIHTTSSVCGRSFLYIRIRWFGGCVAKTYYHHMPARTLRRNAH